MKNYLEIQFNNHNLNNMSLEQEEKYKLIFKENKKLDSTV